MNAAPSFGLDDLPLRDVLRGRAAYGAPQLAVPVRLNLNENPYPPPAALISDVAKAVAEVGAGLNRYPDREATALRRGLADFLELDTPGVGLDVSRVWAANGSNEVMTQLLQAFGGPGRILLATTPSYSMYPDYAVDTATEFVTVPRLANFALDIPAMTAAIAQVRPSVVLLASPNNPTGTALTLDDIRAVHTAVQEHGQGVVVIDEAYAEFRRAGVPSALTLLADHPRLIVTRTMSKAFAYAGARLGYLAAHPSVVEAVTLVRLPYHLSAVTQVVAEVALRHAPALLTEVASLRAERDQLVIWLRDRGLTVADSDANFVYFSPPSAQTWDRSAVFSDLLEHGVLIREVGPAPWLRVSIGTPKEMAAFKAALIEVVDLTTVGATA